jgi:hypothetical protein
MDQMKTRMGANSARGSAKKYKTNPALLSSRVETDLQNEPDRLPPTRRAKITKRTQERIAKWVCLHAPIYFIHNRLYPDWVRLAETSWAGPRPVRS